jgi:hypothetical protein
MSDEDEELYEEVSKAALWIIYIAGAFIFLSGVFWLVNGGKM